MEKKYFLFLCIYINLHKKANIMKLLLIAIIMCVLLLLLYRSEGFFEYDRDLGAHGKYTNTGYWDIYPNTGFCGYQLGHRPDLAEKPYVMKKLCRADCNCQGFSTDGTFYYHIPSGGSDSTGTDNWVHSPYNLYVKYNVYNAPLGS